MLCGKGITQTTHLKVHIRTLDGPRPSMCTVCGKTIAIASDMRKHLVIHDRENVEEPNILDTAVLKETSFKDPDFVPRTNYSCRRCQIRYNTKR